MTVAEEKLAGVDQALAELGKSDEDVADVRNRLANEEPVDLQAVDGELSALSEGVSIERKPATEPGVTHAGDEWENESTEVEVIDDSDFVLLVDEDDLEELEKVGEDDARMTTPPALPREGEEDEDDEGFFKKLFGTRRTSNRP